MQMLKSAFQAVDLSSRSKRRKAVTLVVDLLERIRMAEVAYMERIPENLHGSDAYDNADCAIGLLDEAIDSVNAVYD